jgi:hypothetical protein
MGQIDKFRAAMSKAKGFARPAKFKIRLHPPGNLLPEFRRDVELFCNAVQMPGHDLQTQKVKYGSAPAREMVVAHGFGGTIKASFYLSADMREKIFFEAWQNLAVNPITHKANYYDNYKGSMEIFQLSHQGNGIKLKPRKDGPRNSEVSGGFYSPDDFDMATYGIEVMEVYPEQVGGIEYDYSTSDEIAILTVQLQYREWRNSLLTKNPIFPGETESV